MQELVKVIGETIIQENVTIEEVIEQVEAEDAARQEALEEPYTADSSAAEDPDEAAASVLDADEISALSDSEVPELPEEGNTGGENTDND